MFPDPVHDEFAGWAPGFAPYGGADVGEIQSRHQGQTRRR